MGRIQAFFFDVDDTLYDSSRQAMHARANAIEAMLDAGLNIERAVVERTLRRVIRDFGSNYPHHFNEVLRELGRPHCPHMIAAAIVAYHNTKLTYLHPLSETIPTLLTLRDRGLKLGVISNGLAVKQWEKLIRMGLQHFFHAVLISEQVGVEKPDAEIFRQACAALALPPEVCAYVGNDPAKDVHGANQAGMVSIRIRQGRLKDTQAIDLTEEATHTITNLCEIVPLVEQGEL